MSGVPSEVDFHSSLNFTSQETNMNPSFDAHPSDLNNHRDINDDGNEKRAYNSAVFKASCDAKIGTNDYSFCYDNYTPPHSLSHPNGNHGGRQNHILQQPPAKCEHLLLDNIIVGYAFGPKKMETMGLIMAEASKALSTYETPTTRVGASSNEMTKRQSCPLQSPVPPQQQLQSEFMELCEESSTATTAATAQTNYFIGERRDFGARENAEMGERESTACVNYFSDNEEDERSLSSTRSSSAVSQRSQRGCGGGGIQLMFLPDSSGLVNLVRKPSSCCAAEGDSVTTVATTATSYRKQGASSSSCSSVPFPSYTSWSKETGIGNEVYLSSASSTPPGCGQTRTQSYYGSDNAFVATSTPADSILSSSAEIGTCSGGFQRHPIRVSFVPIDLDTSLEEQHGGKFDVILHKMTEDILCISKMFRAQRQIRASGELQVERNDNYEEIDVLGIENNVLPTLSESMAESEDSKLLTTTVTMTRHQARAARRIQRLRDYKQKVHSSCVLVDSPTNILAVMSRADMAEVLSSCLEGVTTKSGIPVRTPRFRVVEEGEESTIASRNCLESIPTRHPSLADEIDNAGFRYPLIAKPLTAAGTKSSHHMGIVMARDGLQRLKVPCLLQEYANHGGKLFKVYVLGESVWVFSRDSLPNLPLGESHIMSSIDNNWQEKNLEEVRAGRDAPVYSHPRRPTESYVEFERPAGSRCYVEFNSQRPYPKLSDFGFVEATQHSSTSSKIDDLDHYDHCDDLDGNQCHSKQYFESEQDSSPRNKKQRLDCRASTPFYYVECQETLRDECQSNIFGDKTPDLASFVTTDEIEPVTTALRAAFGLELFGFDIIVAHGKKDFREQKNIMDGDGNGDEKEILVVDVNYFPGYKEVPNFPSLLAQYLTQKAVESRMKNLVNS